MNKSIIALAALLLSMSSAFAHDDFVRRGGGYGPGGRGYIDPQHHQHHQHDHRGPSFGQVVGAAVVLGAVAVVLDRALPPQPGVVVYAPQQIECRDMFVPVRDQFGRVLFDQYTGQQRVTRVRVC